MENQFLKLEIKQTIKEAIKEAGYVEMTPIQKESLPIVLNGNDIIAQAPTGTGKTCCFAIPAINIIDDTSNVQVLAMCPTRELALQVTSEINKLAMFSEDVKTLAIYGGQDIQIQLRSLKRKPQIIVGTPGRIIDHLKRGTLKIDHIKMLILDEADEMFNMGFREDIDEILESVSNPHQTILFSATMPDDIKRIVKNYQKDAIHVKTLSNQNELPPIKQSYVIIDEKNKINCLTRMIDSYNFKQALVFCKTKKKVDELVFTLTSRKYPVECLHGDITQQNREKVIELFRKGLSRVLIATDVAARGLDIEGIDVVFNYDIPDDVEYYVHRIGRTARAGRMGSAYTFVSKKEEDRIKFFAKKLKVEINQITAPSYSESEKKKVNHTLVDLTKVDSESNEKYINYINDFINNTDITSEQIAALLLEKMIGIEKKFGDDGDDLAVKGRTSTRTNYTRMFINLGKKDELNKESLRKVLSDNDIISSNIIMGIEILDAFSFFEIPSALKDDIMSLLNNTVYNNRKINIEISASNGSSSERKERKSFARKREGSSDNRYSSRDSRRSDSRQDNEPKRRYEPRQDNEPKRSSSQFSRSYESKDASNEKRYDSKNPRANRKKRTEDNRSSSRTSEFSKKGDKKSSGNSSFKKRSEDNKSKLRGSSVKRSIFK